MKYAAVLTDENGKKILPNFFSHITRKKGYYDPIRKSYVKHKSQMDYLIGQVNSFRVKHPHKQVKYKLVSMFDESKYCFEDVDFRQINRVIGYINDYSLENRKIYASSNSSSEKHRIFDLNTSNLVSNISQETINTSTMYHMLKMVENPDMRAVKNVLFAMLFKGANKCFCDLVKLNEEPISRIEMGGDDLYLFGYGFKRLP